MFHHVRWPITLIIRLNAFNFHLFLLHLFVLECFITAVWFYFKFDFHRAVIMLEIHILQEITYLTFIVNSLKLLFHEGIQDALRFLVFHAHCELASNSVEVLSYCNSSLCLCNYRIIVLYLP